MAEYNNKKIRKFENKNVKKKNKAVRGVLFFLCVVAICLGLYAIFNLSYFNVTEILVIGNNHYTQDEVVESSKITVGENMFGQALFKGSKGVLNLPYVESAKIKLGIPNKIKIVIKERESTYYAYDKEKNIYYRLTSEGIILEEAKSRNEGEIILNGVAFDSEVKFGEKISEIYLAKLRIYEEIKKEYEKSNISLPITKVSFENSLTSITLNDKLTVIFPELNNLKYNIAFLGGIIKNIGEDSVGVIDLNKENPTFSNF